jgi:hypothetical protein
MAAARRDRNKNFFKWEPVEEGSNRFTPNDPPNWLYEIVEPAYPATSERDEFASDAEALWNAEGVVAAEQLRRMTPSNEELLRAAKNHPPPREWFSRDEERPF